MSLGEILPVLNAALNATSAVFIGIGWRAARGRAFATHWKCMAAAAGFSTLFLISYLTRVALFGAHSYPGAGWSRSAYLIVLVSHMVLAAVTPPLVIRTIWLAARRRFDAHRRLVRWTLPIWAYVSLTGVIIYLMLYHLGPATRR